LTLGRWQTRDARRQKAALSIAASRHAAAPLPAALDRADADLAFARPRRALIQHHRHVGTQVLLDGHDLSRAEEDGRAVQMRLKVIPSSRTWRNLARLKTWNPPLSVRIGPSIPWNLCNPPSHGSTLNRPQIEVVRVGENDLGAISCR